MKLVTTSWTYSNMFLSYLGGERADERDFDAVCLISAAAPFLINATLLHSNDQSREKPTFIEGQRETKRVRDRNIERLRQASFLIRATLLHSNDPVKRETNLYTERQREKERQKYRD